MSVDVKFESGFLEKLQEELEEHNLEISDRDPEVTHLTLSPERLKVFMSACHCSLAQPQ